MDDMTTEMIKYNGDYALERLWSIRYVSWLWSSEEYLRTGERQ